MASKRDTRGNTIENWRYLFVDVCMSFCTLTHAFLCLLVVPQFPNLHYKINILPLRLGCFWMPQDTLRSFSNSLELLVFSSRKMLWQMATMVLKPFTRCNFLKLLFFVAVIACCQKILVIQIVRMTYIIQKIRVLGKLR